MGVKSAAGRIYAKQIMRGVYRWAARPVETQNKQLQNLLKSASATSFAKEHGFDKIRSYSDFKAHVPIRSYEGFKPYIDRIMASESSVTWPGKPLYLCKTSGTTSGTKYIPLSKESMPFHIKSARNALLAYINETGKADFVDGKMIFLQGSPVLLEKNGQKIGRLSGIVANYVPAYLQRNRLPSYKVNCMEDWEEKVEAIVQETKGEKMTLIGGIPSWLLMYFERLQAACSGKTVGDIFPSLSLLVYGGVNFRPYQSRFQELLGRVVDSIELYPCSEGFIAFQDKQNDPGMLLQLNSGIFYEFIPEEEIGNEQPARISIEDVQVGKNYSIVLSTNAGLWAYEIGDMVKFTSTDPYRLIVSGRTKHFISAFGEHVIAEEVEKAISAAIADVPAEVAEFTVAPQVNPKAGLPYHEWFIEFSKQPSDLEKFRQIIDHTMCQQNIYYRDLIQGKVLQPAVITAVRKGAFTEYMKQIGKLGGQNKIPRLADNRKIAEVLEKWKEI